MTDMNLIATLGARRNGAGWVARCVAHEDRSPSMSIGFEYQEPSVS